MHITWQGITLLGMSRKIRLTPIQAKRRDLRMSGYALAKAVGTTPSHIQRIERGQSVPNVRLGIAIAKVLGMDVGNAVDLFPEQEAAA